MIDSWSFSKLSDFETCKYYAYLKHDQRIPEPERPLPPGKTEHANDRGSRIHQLAEDYVRGIVKTFPMELFKFQAEFLHLRNLFQDGKVSMEGEWGVDEEWEVIGWNGEWQECAPGSDKEFEFTKIKALPTRGKTGDLVKVGKLLYAWMPVWHRSKVDVIVHTSKHTAIIIDHKTGKRFGNELKHGQQLQLYTVNALMRFPDLEEVSTELWYLDQDEISSMTFTRNQGLRFKPNFDRRGRALTSAVDFPPSPSIFACRWCPYGETGHCKVSAKLTNKPARFIPIKAIA